MVRIVFEQRHHLFAYRHQPRRYGESEKNLGQIFDVAEELGDSIVFIDEVDALATRRSGSMHEATRRILSVRAFVQQYQQQHHHQQQHNRYFYENSRVWSQENESVS